MLGVWVDVWISPTGAFLAVLLWVYFTEFTASLDLSGHPICQYAHCLMS